jgi:hypothetical protein
MKKLHVNLWLVSLTVGVPIVLPLWWRGMNMNPRDLILLQLAIHAFKTTTVQALQHMYSGWQFQ